MPVLRPFLTISRLRLRQFDRISLATERGNDSFLPFLCFDFHLIVSLCTFDYDCNRMYNKTSRSVGLIQPLDHRGLNLNKHRLLTTDSYYNNSNCQSNTTREINCFSKMALKWLNRLSSLLQHLFDLTAIKTEMIMMMMLKVLMQCSSFYNMIHQNLHMHNNFIFAGWTVFNRKINIFEIISLQLSYLEKSVHQPAIS